MPILAPRIPLKAVLLAALASASALPAQAVEAWQLAGVEHFYANDAARSGIYRSQGIATDGQQWFFSWQYGLERAGNDFVSLQRNSSFQWPASLSPGIPPALLAQGLNHIGDIDYDNGIIYASLDSTAGYRKPHIALFNAADLSYTGVSYAITGAPANPNNDVASWFAVDTARGLGYGKEWQNGNTINVYNLADWSFSHTITLDTSTHNIQGAKVRGDWLYMSSDNATQSIYRANLVNGRVEELFQLPSPTGEREVEGIALRDNGAGGFDLYAELIVDPIGQGFKESNTQLRVDLYRYTLAAAVPEPQTWALMLIGLGLLGRRVVRLRRLA